MWCCKISHSGRTTILWVPNEGGEMWLARLADVDRDVSHLLCSVEERELWEDHFVCTDPCLKHLRCPILKSVSSGTLDSDQEVAVIPTIKDLAEVIR